MEESIIQYNDLGGAELPASAGGVLQSEPVAVECLRDNGCSIDTLNSTSCPTHVGVEVGGEGGEGSRTTRKKRKKREEWSKEERKWLWECSLMVPRAVAGKRNGYQKKVYDLYAERNSYPSRTQ